MTSKYLNMTDAEKKRKFGGKRGTARNGRRKRRKSNMVFAINSDTRKIGFFGEFEPTPDRRAI